MVGPYDANWLEWLITDVAAGITVALTLIPQGSELTTDCIDTENYSTSVINEAFLHLKTILQLIDDTASPMSFYTRFQFPTPYFFSFFFFNFLTSSSSVALSYAALANLPPVLGLYAAIIPSACYSFLGSSMQVGTSRRR